MKLTNTQSMKSKSGMTLLELTVVILVLLSLISILFIGARAWKKGSDRAGCILNIRNSQQAVRGYLNMHPTVVVSALTAANIYGGADGYLKFPKCPEATAAASTTAPVGYSFTPANAGVDGNAAGASICLVCTVNPTDHVPDGDLSQW